MEDIPHAGQASAVFVNRAKANADMHHVYAAQAIGSTTL